MYHLNIVFRGKSYRFNNIIGILFSKRVESANASIPTLIKFNKKAENILNTVIHPYKISNKYEPINQIKITKWAKIYALLLIWLYRHFYPGISILSKLRFNLYDSAIIASDVFCKIHPSDQRVLCLPRSIFAATTSKQFRDNGALFIGVFFPSRHMHAWIIENGKNAYRHDYIWTNFTPISMMI